MSVNVNDALKREPVDVLRQSSLGKVSCIIFCVQITILILALPVAQFLIFKGIIAHSVKFNIIRSFIIVGSGFAQLMGIALGIAGINQWQVKKLYPMLGLILNALSLFLILLFVFVGTALRSLQAGQ